MPNLTRLTKIWKNPILGQREELASWIFTSTLENIPKLVAAKTYYPKIFKNCFQPQARYFQCKVSIRQKVCKSEQLIVFYWRKLVTQLPALYLTQRWIFWYRKKTYFLKCCTSWNKLREQSLNSPWEFKGWQHY